MHTDARIGPVPHLLDSKQIGYIPSGVILEDEARIDVYVVCRGFIGRRRVF